MAKKFVEFENTHGSAYSFGMFAKALLPRPADWADEYGSTKGYNDREKHSGTIPKELREKVVGVTFANHRSANPLPVLLKIGANVDASYDLQIKNFVHEGIEYIGVLMLCPNPALKSAVKSQQPEKALAQLHRHSATPRNAAERYDQPARPGGSCWLFVVKPSGHFFKVEFGQRMCRPMCSWPLCLKVLTFRSCE